jgi:hypothetical protein
VALFVFLSVFSCRGNRWRPPKQEPGAAGRKSVDLRANLPRFAKILEPEIQPGPLFKDDAFLTITKNATAYMPDALAVLADASVPEEEKHMAVLTMEGLSFRPFLGFFRACYGLVSRREMKEGWLSLALVPGQYFDNELSDRYRDSEAQRLLLTLEQDSRLSPKLRDLANAFRRGQVAR